MRTYLDTILLAQRTLCAEEQMKAYEALDQTLYSRMSSIIREVDRNIERIDNEFAKCNERITNSINALQLEDQRHDVSSNTKLLN